MIKLNNLLAIGLFASLLVGCYNKGELKRNIQAEYDRMRELTQSHGDFCFYLGSVKFPYTDVPITATDSQWQTWNKEDLARTLPLFSEIGLLVRQPVEGQPGLYHYQLTELGKQYQYLASHTSQYGNVYNDNQFCYGKRKLLEVTDTKDHEFGGGKGNSSVKQNQVLVSYNFQIEDIPTWYTDHFDKLAKVYGLFITKVEEDKIYEGSIRLIKGKDGALYSEDIGPSIRKPAGE